MKASSGRAWYHIHQHWIACEVATLILIGIIVLIMTGYQLDWTGFKGKTLWDWLNVLGVLAIPVVVGIGTAWISTQQAQESALHQYLDTMAALLLNKNLRESNANTEVRAVARARTWTVLRLLDPARKEIIFKFLQESDLIHIIDLSQADLSGMSFRNIDLRGANLSNADLSNADLWGANLDGINFMTTNVTTRQLLEARSLKGTIMPDGSIHQ